MSSIISGASLGLVSSSLSVLGTAGKTGHALEGRGNEAMYVNAATGNLILQRRDEWLISRGIDNSVLRTYNSQGQFTDDNGDNWRLGFSRKVYGLTGTPNTAGSTIKRIDEDGAEVTYTYDTSRSKY